MLRRLLLAACWIHANFFFFYILSYFQFSVISLQCIYVCVSQQVKQFQTVPPRLQCCECLDTLSFNSEGFSAIYHVTKSDSFTEFQLVTNNLIMYLISLLTFAIPAFAGLKDLAHCDPLTKDESIPPFSFAAI